MFKVKVKNNNLNKKIFKFNKFIIKKVILNIDKFLRVKISL